jgi:hypothetical protein
VKERGKGTGLEGGSEKAEEGYFDIADCFWKWQRKPQTVGCSDELSWKNSKPAEQIYQKPGRDNNVSSTKLRACFQQQLAAASFFL